jgi:energy-coupling factor transporter transmembrane protein EcfT
MKDFLNITIENILQIIALLLQTIGIFLIKPEIFDPYKNTDLFVGGNFYNFLLIFLTIIFLYLSYSYEKLAHAKKWFFCFIVFGVFFITSFYYFNKTIEEKSTIFYSENVEPTRYIKGDNYCNDIRNCANAMKKDNPDVTDLEVIQNCADVTDPNQLYKVWPEKQIMQNISFISLLYCISISLASITILSGLQAIKCKRVKI